MSMVLCKNYIKRTIKIIVPIVPFLRVLLLASESFQSVTSINIAVLKFVENHKL